MTTHPTHRPPLAGAATPGGDQPIDVIKWRLLRLCENGFPLELAQDLALEPHVDLHALLALVDVGCPPHLAARIMSPAHWPVGRYYPSAYGDHGDLDRLDDLDGLHGLDGLHDVGHDTPGTAA